MKTQNVYSTFSVSLSLLFSVILQAGCTTDLRGVLALTTSPKEAEIYVDGQLKVNQTPVIFRLSEGKHQIVIKAPGKRDEQLEVLMANDAVISKQVVLVDDFPMPEMVIIPAGAFRMGDIRGTGDSDEQPVHIVQVKSFAMSRHEVTFEEYDYFVEQTGRKKPKDEGWGRGNRPVINISWDDATAYAEWLSGQTGKQYRLPTEAEWEYAARAGTETDYWWGNEIGKNRAACDGCGAEWGWDAKKMTAPVCSFVYNPFGLCDTVGNVWEWTCSEYEGKYNGKELECLGKNRVNEGSLYVIRGGAWLYLPRGVRASYRNWNSRVVRFTNVGFRLVRM